MGEVQEQKISLYFIKTVPDHSEESVDLHNRSKSS